MKSTEKEQQIPERMLKVDEYVNENRLTLSFGKHRHKHISKVPKKYLKWMLKELPLPPKIIEAVSFEINFKGTKF